MAQRTHTVDRDYDRRLGDVKHFYALLDELATRVGGTRRLCQCDARIGWPARGVYFFFEPGELRTTSGTGPRVVRIGTHALATGSTSTLWSRLRQHRGTLGGSHAGGGNHRGSIFRLHVGTALIRRDGWPAAVVGVWGIGSSAKRAVRDREVPLEKAVSAHIGSMPCLWLAIDDPPAPTSDRGYIERNAIALLSNRAVVPAAGTAGDTAIDLASPDWLGHHAASEDVRRSGLWNVNHVGEEYDPAFLDVLEGYVITMTGNT